MEKRNIDEKGTVKENVPWIVDATLVLFLALAFKTSRRRDLTANRSTTKKNCNCTAKQYSFFEAQKWGLEKE
jgi:hypothetical protein